MPFERVASINFFCEGEAAGAAVDNWNEEYAAVIEQRTESVKPREANPIPVDCRLDMRLLYAGKDVGV